jgi:outer membrane autotransporter protein
VNTFLGADASPSDKLVINGGSATGFTTMLVTNAGGGGALTVANGILVVDDVTGQSTAPGAFALGRPVVAGPFEYQLFRGSVDASAPESWFLRSTISCALPEAPSPLCPGVPGPTPPQAPNFRQEVSLYAVLPALTLLYGRSLLDTLHERVGEEEHLRGRRDLSGSPYVNGAWGRVIAQTGDRDGDRAGIFGDGPQYGFDFMAVQAGLDVYRTQLAGGYRAHAGLYGALGDGRSDVTHFTGAIAGRDTFAAYTGGGYVTLFGPTSWYLDGVVQGTFYDMKGQSTRFPALETDGTGLAASIEAAVPFRFGGFFGGWTVEPQAQLVYQSVDLDSGRDVAATVRFEDIESLAGRLGVRFASTWAMPAGLWSLAQPGLVTAWFRPNYWHEFSDEARTLFSSETGFIPFRADLGEAWIELNGGTSARVDRTTELYANASYQFGVEGDSEAWGGKVGLRVNW